MLKSSTSVVDVEFQEVVGLTKEIGCMRIYASILSVFLCSVVMFAFVVEANSPAVTVLHEVDFDDLVDIRGGECLSGYFCAEDRACSDAGIHGCEGTSPDNCTTGSCTDYCKYTTGTYSGCEVSELSSENCDTNECAADENCGSPTSMRASDSCASGCACSFTVGGSACSS